MSDSETPRQEVLVVDFGSQYGQLIARRVREHHVFCRIVTPAITAAEVRAARPAGIILSGGPASVYAEGAPTLDPEILELGIPVLGICYGMQLLTHLLGARIAPARDREFGHRTLEVTDRAADLFTATPERQVVWMSHGDQVEDPGHVFEVLARTDSCPNAAIRHRERPFYGLQFHPEVVHSEHGKAVIGNFLYRVCRLSGDWRMSSFIDSSVAAIRDRVGDRHVVCGVSGGVDSSVAAALVHRAVGDQLHCIFVDNGLLRAGEADEVQTLFAEALGMDCHRVDAQGRFLTALAGVIDPEVKRKRIGHVFIDVFKDEAERIRDAAILVQGTLYPDVVESESAFGGPTATIKTHHNVGGLPEELGFELLEPLRELFKDEVRELGLELGLPDGAVWRQPFPGPGLAVRILGEVTRDRLEVLRAADRIVRIEVERAGLTRQLWQSFAVLLPIQSVGVMGDQRTYEDVCAIRAVTSTDAMTAEWARLPDELLATMSRRIVNEVRGINRVVYDISSKPPSTIEWE